MRMMVVLAAGGSVELSVLSRCVGRFPEGRVPRRRRVVLGLSTDSSTGLRSIQRTICGRAALTATHCNTLHHTAPHCTTLHHTAPHCNALQHTATHCNTLNCIFGTFFDSFKNFRHGNTHKYAPQQNFVCACGVANTCTCVRMCACVSGRVRVYAHAHKSDSQNSLAVEGTAIAKG